LDRASPIGPNHKVNGQSLVIVGVTASKEERVFFESGWHCLRTLIYRTKTVIRTRLPKLNLHSKQKKARINVLLNTKASWMLLSRHKLSDPTRADFSILSPARMFKYCIANNWYFTALLSGAAVTCGRRNP